MKLKRWMRVSLYLLIWGVGVFHTSLSKAACTEGVCVSAGSRLASLDTGQSALLNPLLSGLLGTNINLTALDWQGLAGANVNLLAMLNLLQADLSLANPTQVLDANLTLAQLVAAIQTQQTEQTVVAALDTLLSSVSGLITPIRLGDLLQTDPEHPELTNIDLGVLQLITGMIQLFNQQNVLTTPTPITIDGSTLTTLGLPNTLPAVQLYAQVVEPPVFYCGPAGGSFHTAQIRLKLDLDLSQTNLLTNALNTAVTNALGIPGVSVTSTITLGEVSLYIETASADGIIQAVDTYTGQVTVEVIPSVANLYLGNIPDSLFFNRTHVINPTTDVTAASIGLLTLKASTILTPNLINLTTDIWLRSVAEGTVPLQQLLLFDPPYPQTQVAGNSTAAVSALLNSLMNNLTVEIDGSLLDVVLNAVISTIHNLIIGILSPLLTDVAYNLLDPLLSLLGIGIGEAEVTVLGDPLGCITDLELIKSVWNVSRNTSGDTATPGEILRYDIYYHNNGQTPLTTLVIQDNVPDFTQLIIGSMACSPTPPELPSCQKSAIDDNLTWSWPANSKLKANSSGIVSFEVQIQ